MTSWLMSYPLFQFDLPRYTNCSYGDYVQVCLISCEAVKLKHLMHLIFPAPPGPWRQCDRASAGNPVWSGSNPICWHLWQQRQVTPSCTPRSDARLVLMHASHCVAYKHSKAKWHPCNIQRYKYPLPTTPSIALHCIAFKTQADIPRGWIRWGEEGFPCQDQRQCGGWVSSFWHNTRLVASIESDWKNL